MPHGNGNFVVTELKLQAAPAGGKAKAVPLTGGVADVSQHNYPASAAVDGNPETGWAIDDGSGHLNVNRTATFGAAQPVNAAGGTLTFRIEQSSAGAHPRPVPSVRRPARGGGR